MILDVAGSYVDLGKIKTVLRGKKITIKELEKLIEEHERNTIHIKKIIRVAYGETFKVEELETELTVFKKLVPKKSLSFFPNIKDQVAEEKSSYESRL